MNSRRVLLIHNILWSHYKAVVFSDLAIKCKQADIDFQVLQTALYGSGQKSLSDVDLSIHSYPYKILFKKSLEKTTILERLRSYHREIKSTKPNVLILPGYVDPAVWLITLYAVVRGLEIIQVVDSTLHDHKRERWKEKVKQIILSPAQLIFCYGTAAKTYLQHLGIPDKKIKIRIQATNNKLFTESYDKIDGTDLTIGRSAVFTVLFIGRLAPEKNLPTLLKAISKLPEDYCLNIVGSGPEEEPLKNLVKELGISHRIHFFSSKPWNELIEFYAHADLFVLPSWSETWGLVINEAMLCHLPVVVSNRCGAAPDIVQEGVNGFTFSPESVEDLVAKIKEVRNLLKEGKAMGLHSAKIIERFSPDVAAQQMLDGIEAVLRR